MSGIILFDYAYGFNPLREYVLVKTGKRTTEQAWDVMF